METIVINSVEQTKARIIEILKKSGYPIEKPIVRGLVETINLVSDYKEEGISYYPELLFVHNISDLQTILTKHIKLVEEAIDDNTFKKILKLCAPLAVNNWHIYVVLKNDLHVEYGLVSAEIKETSLSLFTQVSELDPTCAHMIYLRNMGTKCVEIVNGNDVTIISLSLDTVNPERSDNENQLVQEILSDLNKEERDCIESFMLKSIREILRAGHGNLIAICKREKLSNVLQKMSNGVTLENPINMLEYVQVDNRDKKNTSSVDIKSYLSLMRTMVNHDGIAIFSTRCELLGFHNIVENNTNADAESVGGARTKAFEALKQIDGISSCFFKSQDGQTKFYKHE